MGTRQISEGPLYNLCMGSDFCVHRYVKSPAQLMIRWCLQKGYMCIPKTTRTEKIKEYGDVFDFQITEEDMSVLVCRMNMHA